MSTIKYPVDTGKESIGFTIGEKYIKIYDKS